MYISACGDIVDCIEFIWGIYTDIVANVHMNILAYVAYLWHVGVTFVVGTCIFIAWKIKVVVWWGVFKFFFYFILLLTCVCSWVNMYTTFLGYMTKKNNVASHIDHLDPRNTMIPLIMLLVSHNANASTHGVSWPKLCGTLFQLSWPKKWNGAIYGTICTTWHWCQHQWHHITKKYCSISFQLS